MKTRLEGREKALVPEQAGREAAEGAAWRARFLERAGESLRGSSRAVRARRRSAG